MMGARSKIALLLVLGWAGYVGGAIDVVITSVALWAALAEHQWLISVDVVLREYIAWLFWVKQLAYHVLPDSFVGRIFGLPALVLFPVRVVVSTLIGMWAFGAANRLRRSSAWDAHVRQSAECAIHGDDS
jgi:hypothetical protein